MLHFDCWSERFAMVTATKPFSTHCDIIPYPPPQTSYPPPQLKKNGGVAVRSGHSDSGLLLVMPRVTHNSKHIKKNKRGRKQVNVFSSFSQIYRTMASKLRNKSAGLKLELNGCYPESDSTGNWRQDIARIVNHDDDVEGSDMKPNDFENAQRLGEGAAGTVWKVVHAPTKLVMAKKVYSKRVFILFISLNDINRLSL